MLYKFDIYVLIPNQAKKKDDCYTKYFLLLVFLFFTLYVTALYDGKILKQFAIRDTD